MEDAKLGAEQRQALLILWRIQCSLGQVSHLLKREDQAHREWSEARDIITKLAATIDETTLREHFLRTALASFPQRKRSGGAGGPGKEQSGDCRFPRGERADGRGARQQYPGEVRVEHANADRRLGR